MMGVLEAGREDRPKPTLVSKPERKAAEFDSAYMDLEPDIGYPAQMSSLAARAILDILAQRHEKLKSFLRGLPCRSHGKDVE